MCLKEHPKGHRVEKVSEGEGNAEAQFVCDQVENMEESLGRVLKQVPPAFHLS